MKQVILSLFLLFGATSCSFRGSSDSSVASDSREPTKLPDNDVLPGTEQESKDAEEPSAQSPITTEYASFDDLRYAEDEDPDHLMGAWLPIGDGPYPAIILLHAGGWRQGNYINLRTWGQYYASRGIASFSIGYQKSTVEEASWPTTIQDVVCAIRHIKSNAEVYRIDPNRIAAIGFSAGGHLASLIGTLQGDETFLDGACGDSGVDSKVGLVVNISGPVDFVSLAESNGTAVPQIIQFLGNKYVENPSIWVEASPQTYVSPDDAIFVIGHGALDEAVPQESAESFVTKLIESGIEVHYSLFDDQGHIGDIPNLILPVLEPLLFDILKP